MLGHATPPAGGSTALGTLAGSIQPAFYGQMTYHSFATLPPWGCNQGQVGSLVAPAIGRQARVRLARDPASSDPGWGSQMVCSLCGYGGNPPGARFCAGCGKPLVALAQSAAASAPAPPPVPPIAPSSPWS